MQIESRLPEPAEDAAAPAQKSFIGVAIDRLRAKLLDLTTRNPLLSFKHSARSRRYVRLIDELPDEVYRRLEQGTQMRFKALPDPADEPRDETTEEFRRALERARIEDQDFRREIDELGDEPPDKPVAAAEARMRKRVREQLGLPPRQSQEQTTPAEMARKLGLNPSFELPRPLGNGAERAEHVDTYLQTLLFRDVMDRTLSRMHGQVRSNLDEMGVNTLYAAYGFLEWYEDSSSEKPLHAPLLLLPLEMQRELVRGQYQFTIASLGEDAEPNVTLAERLMRDFEIVLPALEDGDTPESYMTKVSEIIADRSGWKVRRWITVGLFSFARIAMYKDLDPEAWPEEESLDSHPRLKQLLVGVDRASDSTGSSNEGETAFATEHDVEEAERQRAAPPLIADADSSQTSVVVDVLQGRDVVVEGPPGTGKSQTITNVIAAALVSGKTVLFLAEKIAALSVVKKRLEEAGLGHFCLELHSTKARRKDAVEALGRRVLLRVPPILSGELNAAVDETEKLRESLAQYSVALNSPAGADGLTVQERLWAAQRIREEHPDLPADLDDIVIDRAEQLSRVEMDVMERDLAIYANQRSAILREYGSIVRHPWWGVAHADLDPFTSEELIRRVRSAGETAATLNAQAMALSRATGMEPQWTVSDLELTARAVLALPKLDASAYVGVIQNLAKSEERTRLRLFVGDCRALQKCRAALCGAFTSVTAIADADPQKLRRICHEAEVLGVGAIRVRELASQERTSVAEAGRLRALANGSGSLAQRFGVVGDQTVATLHVMVRGLNLALAAPSAAVTAREPGLIALKAVDAVERASVQAVDLSKRQRSLEARLRLESAPAAEVCAAHAVAIRGRPFIAILSKEYRRARANYRALARSKVTARADQIAEDFETLAKFKTDLSAFESDAEIAATLGRMHRGLGSDFAGAQAIAKWASAVRGGIPATCPENEQVSTVLLKCAPEEFERLRAISKTELVGALEKYRADSPETTIQGSAQAAEARQRQLSELHIAVKMSALGEEVALSDCLGIADALESERMLRGRLENDAGVRTILGSAFSGPETNPGPPEGALQFVDAVSGSGLSTNLVEWFLSSDALERVAVAKSIAADIARDVQKIRDRESALLKAVQPDYKAWLGADHLTGITPEELRVRFERCVAVPESLQSLIDDMRSAGGIRRAGLGSLLDSFHASKAPLDKLPVGYRRGVHVSCARAAVIRSPALARFVGMTHDAARARYQELDRKLLKLRRQRLAYDLSRRPVDAGRGYGPKKNWTGTALILNEASKERRHISVRDLLERAGTAAQQLMPCFMMSPLSVAQYLRPGGLRFDLVIMDEASQLRPEDAMGAVARSGQLLIVGDPKQLPPTSFFDSTSENMIAEGEESGADEESVLDAALQTLRPARRLKWHYRSRHGSLIAFSNREFYDDDLIVFPSPVEDPEDIGVRYVHIPEGCYKPGTGTNIPEVERVAGAAIDLMRRKPHRSLGIVTLNKAQQEHLTRRMEELIAGEPLAADYMKRWDATLEPFFVKNLENVQGDERDTIFISTVYGRDASGNLYQRFGPINTAGGHRRLNVFYTRAKYQTVVFSSMDPGDIRVEETSSRGVKAFHGFLRYAKSGHLESLEFTGREPDSDFEICVARALKEDGYEVVPQLGVSGYFLDIAVRDPKRPGSFILAVECDGATYHSAKCTRDRDRLRQEILERLGWRIHRIWSLDWFRNPARERQRLREAAITATKTSSQSPAG